MESLSGQKKCRVSPAGGHVQSPALRRKNQAFQSGRHIVSVCQNVRLAVTITLFLELITGCFLNIIKHLKILHRCAAGARLFAISAFFVLIPPPLFAQESGEVFYRSNSDWGAGVVGEFTVLNAGSSDIAGWTLEFDFPSKISTMWGGQIVSQEGDHYVVAPLSWNEKIYPGSRAVVGFQAAPGGAAPTKIRLKPKSAAPPVTGFIQPGIKAEFKIASDWGAALQADFTLTNTGSETLKNWSLEFDLSRDITSIWNATVRSHKGARYRIDASAFDWNRDIAPGATVRFGFIARPGSLTDSPKNIRVQGTGAGTPQATPAPSATPFIVVEPTPRPTPTGFNYAEALQKSLLFYDAQRSGALPSDRRVRWRGDSALKDGADAGIDLSGGYFDAGDHMKFVLPLCSALTMLSWGGVQYPEGYQQAGQWTDLLNTVRWGTDWILKAHTAPDELYGQVGQGNLDHAYWGPPETLTMPRPSFKIDATKPGSELAGEAAAALASASILFRKSDEAYSRLLLEHARQLFAFAEKYPGKYTDAIPDARNFYNSFTGFQDELAWAAVWLHKATGEKGYLAKAEDIYQKRLKGTLIAWTQSWDDKRYGTATLLAQLTRKDIYKQDTESFLDYWTIGRNGRRVNSTSGGLAWLSPWGSLRYAANTAFLAFVYSDTFRNNRDRYRSFAERQINYILGDNPPRRSYMVGFGKDSPRNPHHRGSHGSTSNSINEPADNQHVLYGALVGGPPTPDDFSYEDKRTNYMANEVALDYNAAFTGALAKMVMLYGGQPLENFPPREEPLLHFE